MTSGRPCYLQFQFATFYSQTNWYTIRNIKLRSKLTMHMHFLNEITEAKRKSIIQLSYALFFLYFVMYYYFCFLLFGNQESYKDSKVLVKKWIMDSKSWNSPSINKNLAKLSPTPCNQASMKPWFHVNLNRK